MFQKCMNNNNNKFINVYNLSKHLFHLTLLLKFIMYYFKKKYTNATFLSYVYLFIWMKKTLHISFIII